ncbi:MAG: DinB family protein [Actinomycetota bacterium]
MATREDLVQRYREGPGIVEQAVAGLSDEELDRRPADGGWSPREVVNHLADSEMTSAIRVRKLLAEDSPTLQGYDEEEFARRLYYAVRPIGPSLATLRGVREATATILENLDEDGWRRAGTHEESGAYSVTTWLDIYAAHAHDHAEQIRRALGADART